MPKKKTSPPVKYEPVAAPNLAALEDVFNYLFALILEDDGTH